MFSVHAIKFYKEVGTTLTIDMPAVSVNLLEERSHKCFNESSDSDFAIWDTCSVEKSYNSKTSPYTWASSHIGLEAQVGVSSYTEKELLDPYRTRLDVEGSYLKVHIPKFNPHGITYYQNSPLVWIWLTDGSYFFEKNNNQVKSASWLGDQQSDSTSSSLNLTAEINEALQDYPNITFHVGGAIKIYNSTIYLCSTHTANIRKHPGDFSIFLAWCLYQKPVVTDDGTLSRDLKVNGATVYHIKEV